jgi:hypothetical protein
LAMDAVDQFVTPREAEVLLEISEAELRQIVAEGHIQPIEIEGIVWFHRAEVEGLRRDPFDELHDAPEESSDPDASE